MKWAIIAWPLLLTACGSSPPARIYALGDPSEPIARASTEAGRPVLRVERVGVPDYLDSTDMLTRDGRNELKASTTGHWGERLSVGVTDALTADLGRRLPAFSVTRTAIPGQSARQLSVDVDGFDMRVDGSCVLSARWTILADDRHTVLATQRDTIVTHAAQAAGATRSADGASDAATAAVMADAVEQLARKIASAPALASAHR